MATTMAVGATILKGGGARMHALFSTFSAVSFRSPRLALSRSPSTITKTGRVLLFRPHHPLSFCTSPTSNPETVSTTAESSSPAPTSSTEKDKVKDENNINVKDAANLLDIRVGRIIKAWRHEEADSLYVEEVDVGEAEPRIICSGLVKYIPIDFIQDKKVVVLANLKPRNMRGVKSSGMLLAASDASHENVELLEPPEGSVVGERIWFGSEEDKENQPPPATPNQVNYLCYSLN